MSGRALEWAMRQEVSATEKLVLAALATFHSKKNERPFPSLSTLAKTASLDEKTVRRTLPKLESLGLIRINRSSGRRSHRYELLLKPGQAAHVNTGTLPMFGDEQPGLSDPQPGLSVPPTRTQSPTNKVLNKDKNKGGGKSATSAPAEFPLTGSLQKWADKNAPGIDLQIEKAKFLDHHRAKGNRFKDWQAAFRNWMRRAVEYAQPKSEQQPCAGHDPYKEATR